MPNFEAGTAASGRARFMAHYSAIFGIDDAELDQRLDYEVTSVRTSSLDGVHRLSLLGEIRNNKKNSVFVCQDKPADLTGWREVSLPINKGPRWYRPQAGPGGGGAAGGAKRRTGAVVGAPFYLQDMSENACACVCTVSMSDRFARCRFGC